MDNRFLRLLLVIFFTASLLNVKGQENTGVADINRSFIDSVLNKSALNDQLLNVPQIKLSKEQAIIFLQEWYKPHYWKNSGDPLRKAIGQLITEASFPVFDSAEIYLKNYPYDSINIPWDKFFIWKPSEPQQPVSEISSDSTDHLGLRLPQNDLKAGLLKDTTLFIISDTLDRVSSSGSNFPFRSYEHPFQGDSIKIAIESLLEFVERRDSSIIRFTGLGAASTPVWLNSKSDIMMRYWLKNEMSDSVTVWIGSPSRNTISLYLERGVNFRKPVRQNDVIDARINVQAQDRSKLLEVQKIVTKKELWKYKTESSFVFSQAALTNWVKGGENSVALAMDVTGYASYNNPDMKLSSDNFARLKYGYIASGGNPIRKNLDLLETNSKLNHKAFGKFDFSGILLFKTQIAPGYNYPNDSVPVSKFMNPAILTVGIGLDYKPNKNTSMNFSPFSYKGTFVPDTANIDQTKYGIAEDRRSKNEPGASFMITNDFKPYKNITVTNRLQLFTNYINKPQNIDVDWEMILTANLNWFTDVRFNTHLIFDDDTKTPVLDKDKNPVSALDGKPLRTARIQFKEMLGFSFVFRF